MRSIVRALGVLGLLVSISGCAGAVTEGFGESQSRDSEGCNELFSVSESELGLTGYDTETATQGLRNFAVVMSRTLGDADDPFLRVAVGNVVELTRDAATKYQLNDGLGNNQISELTDAWLAIESRCRDLIDGRNSNLAMPPAALSDNIDVRFVAPYDIRVGDCLLEESDRQNFGAIKGTTETVAITDCANLHDSEFYAGTTMDAGQFPGLEAVANFGIDFCLTEFDKFVGIVFEDSTLRPFYLSPSAEEWGYGNRTILCGLYDPKGPVEGSLGSVQR